MSTPSDSSNPIPLKSLQIIIFEPTGLYHGEERKLLVQQATENLKKRHLDNTQGPTLETFGFKHTSLVDDMIRLMKSIGYAPTDFINENEERDWTPKINVNIQDVPADMAAAFHKGFWNLVPVDKGVITDTRKRLAYSIQHFFAKPPGELPFYAPDQEHSYRLIFNPFACTFLKPDGTECKPLDTIVSSCLHPMGAVLTTRRAVFDWHARRLTKNPEFENYIDVNLYRDIEYETILFQGVMKLSNNRWPGAGDTDDDDLDGDDDDDDSDDDGDDDNDDDDGEEGEEGDENLYTPLPSPRTPPSTMR
ncbi:hypothetical protein CVT24_005854 [Panaeolus cyanescens]|uniref:Uncharacterized protein n=1 Tax=Panaeolus cyanescens TaxID=181874 RepID=A0A409YEZ0_9AGAR|nr:hypothetical protein CVT24_005854 [Panaeolus cyanescens]